LKRPLKPGGSETNPTKQQAEDRMLAAALSSLESVSKLVWRYLDAIPPNTVRPWSHLQNCLQVADKRQGTTS
jgi:hypothetical protein